MSRVRILVAEDHPWVRESLVQMLERDGMEVVGQARDGIEAVDLHRLHRPQITLMDLRMPRLDGLSALRQILEEAPGAIIVVLTNIEEKTEACLTAGARAVLHKNTSKDELLAQIREAI